MGYFVGILVMCVALIMFDTFKCEKVIKQLLYGVTVILFILLATIRPLDFPDTLAYIEFYDSQIGVSLFAPNDTRFEWGFVLLTRICIFFTKDYRMLFFVQALIVNLIVMSVLKDKDCKLMLYACFIAFYGIYATFIILRGGLSLAFFVLGVIRFDKNWWLRILCFAVSICFHMSAAIMIVVYLFAYLVKKINIRAEYALCIFIILLICFASGLSKQLLVLLRSFLKSLPNQTYFVSKGVEYLTHNINMFEFGLSFRYLLNTIFYLLALIMIKKYNIKLSATMRANMIYIFLGLCLESYLGNMRLIGRLTDFTNIINLCSIGIIVNNNMPRGKACDLFESNTMCINKVIGRQLFSFTLGFIFVCFNLVFMYRIAY